MLVLMGEGGGNILLIVKQISIVLGDCISRRKGPTSEIQQPLMVRKCIADCGNNGQVFYVNTKHCC